MKDSIKKAFIKSNKSCSKCGVTLGDHNSMFRKYKTIEGNINYYMRGDCRKCANTYSRRRSKLNLETLHLSDNYIIKLFKSQKKRSNLDIDIKLLTDEDIRMKRLLCQLGRKRRLINENLKKRQYESNANK
jgi:hypothetical protein